MDIIYIDESGDDGLAPGASPLFALALVIVPSAEWLSVHRSLLRLRDELQSVHGLPVSVEWHARPLLLRKHPYRELGLTSAVIQDLCQGLTSLIVNSGLRIEMWVVAKRHDGPWPLHSTLLPALVASNGSIRLVFSDEGRIGTMRRLVRDALNRGLLDEGLVESVVGMTSSESFLVQLADVFATAAYLRAAGILGIPLHARMQSKEVEWISDIASGPNRMLNLVRA